MFGEFYEKLHDDDEDDGRKETENEEDAGKRTLLSQDEIFWRIPEFTTKKVQEAIDRIFRARAGESSGIKAEHIKRCDNETKEWIRQILNETVQQENCTPQTWRRIPIKVIHKNGDVEDAGNYRPICSLPVLHKLFTTELCARLVPRLDSCQPPDQSGFRPSHPTVDHLMVYRMLEQCCCEWSVRLCFSTIAFTKAFDRIKHQALRMSLEHYGIGRLYISLLNKALKTARRISHDRQKRVQCSR